MDKKLVKQEKLMFRVPNTKEGNHILHNIKKSLNSDSYSMWTKFTGPRPKGTPQGSTLKENAKSIRVYIESKREEDNINPYDYIARGREIEKQQQELKQNGSENHLEELHKANHLLETKLSLLTAGLKNSAKYRHFVDTVNSITETERISFPNYSIQLNDDNSRVKE